MVAKAAIAVVSGAILGLRLQPYEAHIPFLLQFKLDMNLYGMAHMVLRTAEFRKVPASGMHAGTHPDSYSRKFNRWRTRMYKCPVCCEHDA